MNNIDFKIKNLAEIFKGEIIGDEKLNNRYDCLVYKPFVDFYEESNRIFIFHNFQISCRTS